MTNPNLPPKPPDFDWVTVRHGCAVAPMFVSLKILAKRDIQKFNELAGAAIVSVTDGPDSSMFSVVRRVRGDQRGVLFVELNDGIMVRVLNGPETELALALDDKADCKLIWDGQPLDPWQVLRRALEPILFPPSR